MPDQPISSNTEQHVSLQPSGLVRRFLSRDKTPVSVLFLSALVGLVAGIVGTLFQIGVDWVSETRTEWLKVNIDSEVILVCTSFAISAVLALFGYFLVKAIAPEAGGSGIPEIEGAMDDMRPVRWWRVLPVKFFGGLGALGSGMVLGREGPTVQMGGNVGRMISDVCRLKDKEGRHSLLAAGAAGGLAAAFNAPLSGIMFVVEEMRPQFRYSLISFKCVAISAVVSDIVFRSMRGQDAVIDMPQYMTPSLESLWLYLLLGMFFGVFGVIFNWLVPAFQDLFAKLHHNKLRLSILIGGLIGGFFGIVLLYYPELTGGGIEMIPDVTQGKFGVNALLLIFGLRILTTLICFCSGAPGGIFAPMLSLGTIFGTFFGLTAAHFFPEMGLQAGSFAVIGMGALFAATVRAPVTGILLVIEMTDNFNLILPLIITTLGATMLAQALGGKPIYSSLLKRTLAAEKKKQQELQERAEQEAAQA